MEFLQVHDRLGALLSRALAANPAFEFPTSVAIIGANQRSSCVRAVADALQFSIRFLWDNFGQFVGSSMQKMLDGELGWKRTLHLIQPSGVVFRHSANHLAVSGQDFAVGRVFHERKNQRADYGKHSLRPVADRPAKVWRESSRNPLIAPLGEMLCQMRVNEAKETIDGNESSYFEDFGPVWL